MTRTLFGVVILGGLLATGALPPRLSGEEHPDLSGVWRSTNTRLLADLSLGGHMPALTPWGAALYEERRRTGSAHSPSSLCLPRGLPGEMLAHDTPWKLVQSPGAVVILFAQSLHYRQIFTDGRRFPEELTSTWYGYSTATWEGDTLVATTIGMNDQTWLDEGGHPHGADMRLTERFRRPSARRLDVQVTIDDPKAYAQPWTVMLRFESQPESALAERVCAAHPVQ